MSQIQEVVTLVLVSILLGATTTTTAIADDYSSSDDSALMPNITKASQANLVQDRATVRDDIYSFTMTLPQKTDSRFAKLSFSFAKPDLDRTIVPINLNLAATTAVIATSGEAIAVKDTWIDETGTVWVEFNSPVAAKTTLTVMFKPQRPLAAGQYTYSIAAYPKLSAPMFVSDGMLNIVQ